MQGRNGVVIILFIHMAFMLCLVEASCAVNSLLMGAARGALFLCRPGTVWLAQLKHREENMWVRKGSQEMGHWRYGGE